MAGRQKGRTAAEGTRESLTRLYLGRFWKRIILPFRLLPKAYENFDKNHGFLLSGGIAFSILICIIPLILLALSILGTYLITDQVLLIHLRRYLANLFPDLDPQIMENIGRIIQDRQIVGILGIGGLVWASTWVFSSLRSALNIVFRVEMGRSLLWGKAVDLAMIFLAGTLLLLSMAITSVIAIIETYSLNLPLDLGPLFHITFIYLIPFIFTLWMFFLVYKMAPNRKVPFGIAFQGALLASLLWEMAKHFIKFYLLHLSRVTVIYGSLSTLAVFFLWIYYSSVVLLFAAEVAALIESQRDSRRPKATVLSTPGEGSG